MKKLGLVFVVVLIGTGAWFWINKTPSANEIAPISAATQNITATVVQPHQEILPESLELMGTLVPRDEIVVASDLNGVRIIEILAEEGDKVKAGQVLARLDTQSLQYQLKQLEAQLKRSQDEFQRLDRIKNSGAVSKDTLSEKWLAYESIKAQFDDLKLKMERSAVLAPASGIIYEKGAAVGTLLNGGEILFRIAGKAKSELEVNLPEVAFPRVKPGQTGQVWVSGFNQPMTGTLRRISPRINSVSRAASLRVTLAPENFLSIGTFARILLVIDQHEGLAVPLSTLQQDNAGHFVWQVNEGKVTRKPVEVLFRNDSQALLQGTSTDDILIAKAGSFLQEGDSIRVVQEATP